MELERVLSGGNFDAQVVRVGNTVRRTAGSWSPAVQALLKHLADAGFQGAPSALGTDDKGREVLSFMDGEAGRLPLVPYMRSDAVLVDVGRMLRRFHDATADFGAPHGASWRQVAADPGPVEVVCHNDWAPYNAVFRNHSRAGFIDWEFARPGSRLWDLAWAAHMWVPLRDDAECHVAGWTTLPDRADRLRRLCDAYGLTDRSHVLSTVEARVRGTADWIEAGAKRREGVFLRLRDEGHAQRFRDAITYLHEAEAELRAGLR